MNRAFKYAQDVVLKKVPAPKYVIKQCENFIEIFCGKSDKYFFDSEKFSAIENILRVLIMPRGLSAGKSIYECSCGYQWIFYAAILCVVYRNNPERRRYETAILEIGRKNFKTFTIATIFILLFLLEPQFSKFYSVAPDGSLSREVKTAIEEILKSSPLVYGGYRNYGSASSSISKYNSMSERGFDGNLMPSRSQYGSAYKCGSNGNLMPKRGSDGNSMPEYGSKSERSSQCDSVPKCSSSGNPMYGSNGNSMSERGSQRDSMPKCGSQCLMSECNSNGNSMSERSSQCDSVHKYGSNGNPMYGSNSMPKCGSKSPRFKLLRDYIECIPTESRYIPLNYSSSRLDGKMPNVFLADEVGALPNSYPLEAMRSGQLNILNKLGYIISTKYPTLYNPFESEVAYAKRILDDLENDETVFSLLFEPNNTEDWMFDDLILKHANPVALEIPEIWEDLVKKRSRAVVIESAKENFLTKHCNIIYSGGGTENFIDIKNLLECRVDKIDWRNREVYVGVDLSMTTDNTAVVICAVDSSDEFSSLRGRDFGSSGNEFSPSKGRGFGSSRNQHFDSFRNEGFGSSQNRGFDSSRNRDFNSSSDEFSSSINQRFNSPRNESFDSSGNQRFDPFGNQEDSSNRGYPNRSYPENDKFDKKFLLNSNDKSFSSNDRVDKIVSDKNIILADAWCFIPENKIEEKSMVEKLDYKMFLESGKCFACGNRTIDYAFVEEFVFSLEDKLGCKIISLGYDRYNAMSSAQKWNRFYKTVEVKQHSSVLHAPTKLLSEKITNGEFVYEPNNLLEINFSNAKCTYSTNMNLFLNKKKSSGKVDMVAALINAVYLLQQDVIFGDGGFVVQVV